MDPKPLWLLAELTYKCPLQCPYCSNPLDFAGGRFKRELSTAEWCRVFREAKALGVLQLGLSGGEPTLRPDLDELIRTAHDAGLYTSLITSAYRLTKERLVALKAAGLDHVEPSWGEPPIELVHEVVEHGYRALIVSVDLQQDAAGFLGRELDADLLTEISIADDLDPCGERGEYHTFVFDGPTFKEPVDVVRGRTVEIDGHRFIDLIPRSNS